MTQLVIEYVFEGHRRGYNYTSPTQGYDDETLKIIWRSAMARGQGWSETQYIGARSIKAFVLPDDRVAVSEVTVTDLEDESGRRGIRRAVIDVMTPQVFKLHLRSRLAGYPAEIQQEAQRRVLTGQQGAARLRKKHPLVLAYPFTAPRDWWMIEALMLMLAAYPGGALKSWGAVIPFTTLALDYRNESRMVALPLNRAQKADIPILRL